jgi:transcription initiation factor TFIIIB Brf1 subunit/transcription initiation factor TFIIB
MPVDSLLPELSMSTCIGGKGRHAARQRLLNRHQPYRERALLKAFREIHRGSTELGLQDAVPAFAKQLLAHVRGIEGVRRGAVFTAMPAVATYYAAKVLHHYRPRDMVCRAFGVDNRDFTKCDKHTLDHSHDLPYFPQMTATISPTCLTSLMLNSLAPSVPFQWHGQLKRTVLKLHELVVANAPEAAYLKDVTLIGAEVLVACELCGIPCPREAAAACAGVSHVTLARYIKRVRDSLPEVDAA